MTLRGILLRQLFAGPVWVLRVDDGRRFELKGNVDEALVEQRVEVEAEPAADAFGFSMVGRILQVSVMAKAPDS